MRRWKKTIACMVMLAMSLSAVADGICMKASAEEQWSQWQDTLPADMTNYEVQSRVVYHYRDKQMMTSQSEQIEGWIRDDSKTESVWGDWSDWKDNTATISQTREVQTRTMTRFRDKKTKTSNSSSLAGWTKYDTKTTWGSWSGWQDAAVSGSATRNVQTQQVQTSPGYTQYRYWRWTNGSWWFFCETCAKNSGRGGTWRTECTPWMNSPITSYDTGQYCNHGYSYKNDGQKTYNYYNNGRKEHYYWQETQNVPATYKTQYRYQDATITYYYYQWGPWSDWSEITSNADENRESQTKKQYRYRDKENVYTYYQWGEWSEYSTIQPQIQENRIMDCKTQYRVRAKDLPTTQTPTTMEPTTQQPSTSEPTDTVTIGNVTVIPFEPKSDDKTVTDKTIKKPSDSKQIIKKGTVLKSDKASYRITSVKKQTIEYVGVNNKKTKNVVIPEQITLGNKTYKVTSIAKNAFKNNKTLKYVKIGKNIKSIGYGAFMGCKKLQKVDIGKNVTRIGSYAFYKCKKLQTIRIYSKRLNKVGKSAFKKIAKHPTAQVPKGKIAKYKKIFRGKM